MYNWDILQNVQRCFKRAFMFFSESEKKRATYFSVSVYTMLDNGSELTTMTS